MTDPPPPSGTPPGGGTAFPLHEAALTLGEPALAQELRNARLAYEGAFRREPRANPFPTAKELSTEQTFVRALALSGEGTGAGTGRAVILRYQQAVSALEGDFRRRVAAGDIVLTGVQTAPTTGMDRSLIPPALADLLRIDWHTAEMQAGGATFAAVRGEYRPPKPHDAGATHPVPLRPEDVPALSEDTLLAVIREQGSRDLKQGLSLSYAAGRPSVMPRVQARMRARAVAGELEPSLAKEADWLADWIKNDLEMHQTPTAKAIKNALRDEYKRLKARNTGPKS